MRPLSVLMLVLYTRLDAAALLSHATRRDILDRLSGNPGWSISEFAGALGLDWKTVLHHARKLEAGGYLVVVREGGRIACYLPGDGRAKPPGPRVVEALHALSQGAASPASLGRALGMPRGTAGSLLRAMESRGLASLRDGRWVVAEAAAELLTGPRNERFSPGRAIGATWSPSNCAR